MTLWTIRQRGRYRPGRITPIPPRPDSDSALKNIGFDPKIGVGSGSKSSGAHV